MKITILGSGSFVIDKKHSGPSYLIQNGRINILVDCGPGTLSRLAEINYDLFDLDYIFITHVHADHTTDLFALILGMYLSVKNYGKMFKKKLTIVGPHIRDFIYRLAETYELDGAKKVENVSYQSTSKVLAGEGFTVYSFPVSHLGTEAYAYRFNFENNLIVFTGDATLTDTLKEAVKDATLLITDCASPKDGPTSAHLNTTQVGELSRECNVKSVILSHQVPSVYSIDVVAQVKEIFNGEVVLARDLMEIEL